MDEGKAHIGHGGGPVHAPLSFHLKNDVLQHLLLVLIQAQLLQHHFVAFDDLGGGNGHHGRSEQGLHAVDVDGAAVGRHLIHHIERHHHRDVHLQKLHGQIEIPGNVGGVDDIDDRLWFFVQHEAAGNELLTAVGGHGIDAGQIRHQRVVPAPDDAVFPADRDAGEIAYMLIGAGELVEQGGLSAVLVADQRKGQRCTIRQRVAAALGMEPAAFAQTWVGHFGCRLQGSAGRLRRRQRCHCDLIRVRKSQCEFIAVKHQLHGIAHGGVFDHRDLCAGDHAHIQKVLAQGAVSADCGDDC